MLNKYKVEEILKKDEQKKTYFWFLIGLGLVVIVGFADYYSGFELSFSLFYLIPIGVVAWYSNKIMGLTMSLIATILWFLIDQYGGHVYSSTIIPYWNAVVRFGFFCIVSYLLPVFKELALEKEVSRIDSLTRAYNRRYLDEILQNELNRFARHKSPFTLIYFDLDGFKGVNDKNGHHIGDQVLSSVVNGVKNLLRKTDLIARVGGDEFVILLFEVKIESVQNAVEKIRASLQNEMVKNNWPITFSMGVITCLSSSISSDDLIKKAYALMYTVKKGGKNGIAFDTFNA